MRAVTGRRINNIRESDVAGFPSRESRQTCGWRQEIKFSSIPKNICFRSTEYVLSSNFVKFVRTGSETEKSLLENEKMEKVQIHDLELKALF